MRMQTHTPSSSCCVSVSNKIACYLQEERCQCSQPRIWLSERHWSLGTCQSDMRRVPGSSGMMACAVHLLMLGAACTGGAARHYIYTYATHLRAACIRRGCSIYTLYIYVRIVGDGFIGRTYRASCYVRTLCVLTVYRLGHHECVLEATMRTFHSLVHLTLGATRRTYVSSWRIASMQICIFFKIYRYTRTLSLSTSGT